MRVATRARQRVEGTVLHVTDTSLALSAVRPDRGSYSVRLADVDSLWERRSAAGAGALVGLIAGGLGAALVACQPSCDESGVIPGALVVGLLGLGVGAMLGSASRSWHRLFPP
jgi:hypothetical protein